MKRRLDLNGDTKRAAALEGDDADAALPKVKKLKEEAAEPVDCGGSWKVSGVGLWLFPLTLCKRLFVDSPTHPPSGACTTPKTE